jgi:hypothetical protein
MRPWLIGGDCGFAIDPETTAAESAIIWTAAVDPRMLMLTRTPHGLEHSVSEPPAEALRQAPEGQFVRYGDRTEPLIALHVAHDGRGDVLSVLIPLDRYALDRIDAALRFWRLAQGASPVPDPRLTPLRRRNLIQMLRAIDGRLAGATYQTIATVLFGASETRAVDWKSDPLRDTVMRRVREGFRLVDGGYRSLLRPHRAG